MAIDAERCETCRFWKEIDRGTSHDGKQWILGDCRRHCPNMNAYGQPSFPRTGYDLWCGDFEPIKTPDAGETT